MGMFDYVKFSTNCPDCGAVISEFQSKDGLCLLQTLRPEEVREFYSSCDSCGYFLTVEYISPAEGYFKEVGTERVIEPPKEKP